MTSNYELLERLHRELQPRGYLEIGVRWGDSLRLAQCQALGIDPVKQIQGTLRANQGWFTATSDEFFAEHAETVLPKAGLEYIDLVYIDGMHLFEYALRDFINVCRWANERTVVVFDDTHPYSQSIATREQPPGDWTGDVWKVMDAIDRADSLDLKRLQVDVSPTGAYVVYGFGGESTAQDISDRLSPLLIWKSVFEPHTPVPEDILDRRHTISPDEAIKRILEDLS